MVSRVYVSCNLLVCICIRSLWPQANPTLGSPVSLGIGPGSPHGTWKPFTCAWHLGLDEVFRHSKQHRWPMHRCQAQECPKCTALWHGPTPPGQVPFCAHLTGEESKALATQLVDNGTRCTPHLCLPPTSAHLNGCPIYGPQLWTESEMTVDTGGTDKCQEFAKCCPTCPSL
jgi:hypothetical protein